jgi:formylmethanofuran dehydrogenase subunit E
METYEKLIEKCVAFHGHICPGLLVGVKAAMYALEIFGEQFSRDEELVCVSENDACGVDAIQVILGCSVGKGNLLFRLRGKQAFSFYDRKSGKSVRMVLKPWGDMNMKEKREFLNSKEPKELFELKEAEPMPEKAIIFKSIPCEICGEESAEYFTRNQDGKNVCLSCFKTYTRFITN